MLLFVWGEECVGYPVDGLWGGLWCVLCGVRVVWVFHVVCIGRGGAGEVLMVACWYDSVVCAVIVKGVFSVVGYVGCCCVFCCS